MTSTSHPRDLRTELESLTTEAFRPELADIDRLPTLDIARLMNGEDATLSDPAAVTLSGSAGEARTSKLLQQEIE
ncbi:hypothetical protein ABZ281_48460, partial [Streptomyces sp. NPDC006265]